MSNSLSKKQIHANLDLIAEQISNINLISGCCLEAGTNNQKNAEVLMQIAQNIDIGIKNLCAHYGFERDVLSKRLQDYSDD